MLKRYKPIWPRSAGQLDVLYVFQSVFLSCLLLLYLFVCLMFVWFLTTFAFPCQSPANVLSCTAQYTQFNLYLSASSTCASHCLSTLCCLFPSLAFSFIQCLSDFLLLFFLFFHSSHPLFISFSSSSLLLGSLLTLLNVRAQTSPCRAAPSHRGQKQLVSFPYPCFLAASVCLSACQCPVIPSAPHLLSGAGWSLVIQTFIQGEASLQEGVISVIVLN